MASSMAGDCAETESVFKAFLIGGILSVMTTGCLLGALALLAVARHQSFVASGWGPLILAHANSQLYGWVGLFVIGFALRQHPPRPGRGRLHRALAYSALGLIASAIPLRFVAELMADQVGGGWVDVGIASAVMQAVAVFLFAANVGLTRIRRVDSVTGTTTPLPWQGKFIYAAIGWWMLVAAAEPFVFALSHQADRPSSILFMAKWFAPYRDVQFLGFVANMIFGMALARLSLDFGAPEPDKRLGEGAFWTWNIGLIVRAVGWLAYFNAGLTPNSAWLEFIGGELLAAGALQAALATGLFGPLKIRSAAHPFLRAAFGWLLAGALLWLLEPLHLHRIGAPFSHAYTGAIRHALTVGFISQMIVGVSLGVIPKWRGRPLRVPGSIWSIFWLLNVGNAARVVCQVGTDYNHVFFAPMGLSGFVELAGLGLWAIALLRVLLLPSPAASRQEAASPTP